MHRHRTALVALALLSLAVLAGCGGGSHATPPAHDLTGTWTNSAGVGTTLVLTQHGSALTWVGGPNDKAWVQLFNGKVVGNAFSGTFAQDAPGVVPQRFHGTMDAQINDDCHFTFTKIAQRGEPVVSNVVFTKTTCALAQPTLTLSLARGRFTPKVPSGARVEFCNDGTIAHTFSATSPGNAFTAPKVKRNTCLTRQLVNSTKAPLDVYVRAAPGRGAVFHVIVEPAP
jgi:hypothetical protein